ncbi:hypothetical protein H5T87_04755 [bacterium]|nr:hypothetical protein [bacterium]
MSWKGSTLISFILFFFVVYTTSYGEVSDTKQHLKNSLVFAISQGTATLKDVEELERMGVDFVVRGISCGWYANPKDMFERSKAVEKALEEAYKRNILWSAMITSSAIIPDILPERDVSLYADRDAFGNVIKPASWWQGCLNNPRFANFVKDIARAAIDAKIWGIHYDESYGHWFWSYPMPCFCDYCIKGFAEWLQKEKPPILDKLGIRNLKGFNYREFLAERKIQDRPWESPLAEEYWRFLLYSTLEKEREIVEDSKRYCRTKWGKELIANANQYDMVNLSAVVLGESSIYDFINIGWGLPFLPHQSSYIPSYLASKACGYDKPVVMFLDIQEEPPAFSALPLESKGQLFRWLAGEAYASGCFYALHHRFSLWAGPVEELSKIGQFIKANPHLFRDTRPLADVYLLYSFASNIYDMFPKYWGRKGAPDHSKYYNILGNMLLDCGVQFAGLFFGEGRTFPDDVATCEKGAFRKLSPKDFPFIIVPSAYALSERNIKMLIDYAQAGGKLILLGDCGSRDEAYRERKGEIWDKISKRKNVIWLKACPWEKPALLLEMVLDSLKKLGWSPQIIEWSPQPITHKILRVGKGKIIIHILNKQFEEGKGFKTVQNLKISLKLPSGFKSSPEVFCYSPDWGTSPKSIQAIFKGDEMFLTLPSFDVWLLIEVEEAK